MVAVLDELERRGRLTAEPKPEAEPKQRGRPEEIDFEAPEVRTYTPEAAPQAVQAPISTHQDFTRYIAMQSQVSQQLQRDNWRNLVRI